MAASQRVGTLTGSAVIVEDDSGFGAITLTPASSADDDSCPWGSFESRVLDAQQMVSWESVSWEASVESANDSIEISVRGGDSIDPDTTWSDWQVVAGSGDPIDLESRYVQYRVVLRADTGPPSTPVFNAISLKHNAGFPETIHEGPHED